MIPIVTDNQPFDWLTLHLFGLTLLMSRILAAVGTSLTSLVMMQFGLSIELITFVTPIGCVLCYATDAGHSIRGYDTLILIEKILTASQIIINHSGHKNNNLSFKIESLTVSSSINRQTYFLTTDTPPYLSF